MMDSNRAKESTRELREKLRTGDAVEVAGYQLSPQLFRSIEELQLVSLGSPSSPTIHWLEVVSTKGSPLPLANQRVFEMWRKSGVPVSITSVVGEAFWATPEITVAPELIHATTSIFSSEP
jgi:hypothetical protein